MAKKILSIDGGGMHGVVPLAVCIAIEKRMGKKLKDIFDLFVGTSTGSLISAAALRGIVKDENGNSKSLGISAENILKIYFERAEDIFGEGARNRLNIKIPILNVSKYPEYKAEGLKKVVNEVLGGGGVTRMGKAEKRLSISAYDVKSREPHFFRSWQEEYRDLRVSKGCLSRKNEVSLVIRASIALICKSPIGLIFKCSTNEAMESKPADLANGSRCNLAR
jgi:patatin-like phospholipase/acyl hydrolase